MLIVASALFAKIANITEIEPKVLLFGFAFIGDLAIAIGILGIISHL